MEQNLNDAIRKMIGEIYDGGCWEPISCLYNRNREAWQLYKFEQTVDFKGERYDVLIIEKHDLDPDDIECLEDSEVVFEKYTKLQKHQD